MGSSSISFFFIEQSSLLFVNKQHTKLSTSASLFPLHIPFTYEPTNSALNSSDQSSLPLRLWRIHRVVCLSETYLFDIENVIISVIEPIA